MSYVLILGTRHCAKCLDVRIINLLNSRNPVVLGVPS